MKTKKELQKLLKKFKRIYKMAYQLKGELENFYHEMESIKNGI